MSKKKTISDILFIFFIILFAISISVHIAFYGSFSLYNNPAETVLEVVTGTPSEVMAETIYEGVNEPTYKLKAKTDINNITNTTNKIFNINKADTNQKVFSIFSDAAIVSSFCLLTVILIIFIIFYSNSFIFLPDDWTLVNQKVRLDD